MMATVVNNVMYVLSDKYYSKLKHRKLNCEFFNISNNSVMLIKYVFNYEKDYIHFSASNYARAYTVVGIYIKLKD